MRIFPAYLTAFFALVFLVHELHDWAHVLLERVICGCWGQKGFDNWTMCKGCLPGATGQGIIFLAGPLVNAALACWSWRLMQASRPSASRSMGVALFFACLPLPRIIATLQGGSDETRSVRMFFWELNISHRHLISLFGLGLVFLFYSPGFIRAIKELAGWKGKIWIVAAFLLVPMYIDRWVVSGLMNELLHQGFLAAIIWHGIPLLLVVWTGLVLVLSVFGRKTLQQLLDG